MSRKQNVDTSSADETFDNRKQKADVKEIVSIKNEYEDVIYGKPRINLNRKFTSSQYIKPNCDSNTCPCHEQERLLNGSLRNLPSDASNCDTDFVSKEFTKQILSWASSVYDCAPVLRSSCKMLTTSDFLFIFGGSNPNISEKALQDVYRFDLLTRRWKKLKVENVPISLISYAICWDPNIDGENLVGYLFGGSEDPDGDVMSNKFYKFTIDQEGDIKFQELKIEIFNQNRKISHQESKNFVGQENIIDSIEKAQENSEDFEQSKVINTGENSIQQNFELQELVNDNKFHENTTSPTLITPEVHKTKKVKSLRGTERDPLKPSARCGSSMAMDSDGKLYIVGGVDKKSYLLDVWIVDTNATKAMWQPMVKSADNLKGRYTHEIVIVEDKILLLGGGDENWSAPFDKIDVFDIKTQQFAQIETLPDGNNGYPKPRKFHSVVKNGNDIYIIGGWLDNEINEQDRSTNDFEEATIFEDIWILSIIKINGETFYRWKKSVSSLKMALFFHTSAVTPEGCIYTFGGCIDAKSMYPSNKLQRVWIQPPELTDGIHQEGSNNTPLAASMSPRYGKKLKDSINDKIILTMLKTKLIDSCLNKSQLGSDIPFIDSLYDKLPSFMTNILKRRQCKIVFPDDTQEYEFHKTELLAVISIANNMVIECIQTESNRVLAVKYINIPRNRLGVEKEKVKKLFQEIKTHLSLLHSQNIVALYGFCACDGVTLKLAMELMTMNLEDLYQMVHQTNTNFPEDLFACIGVSVINALEACGKNNIVHRDIKPCNVLLDEQGRIKLCDFGESRSMKDEEFLRTFAGTAYYLAPERLEEDKPYDRRADIWSFGIMLAEIANGKIPYLDKNGETPKSILAIHFCIMNAKAEEIIQRCIKPRKYNLVIEDLVGLCLAELEKRPEKYEMLKNTSFYAHFSNVVNEGIVVGMLEKLKDSGLLTI